MNSSVEDARAGERRVETRKTKKTGGHLKRERKRERKKERKEERGMRRTKEGLTSRREESREEDEKRVYD